MGCLLSYGMMAGDGFAARMLLIWSSGGSARKKLGWNEARRPSPHESPEVQQRFRCQARAIVAKQTKIGPSLRLIFGSFHCQQMG